jgi:hypothetical protein
MKFKHSSQSFFFLDFAFSIATQKLKMDADTKTIYDTFRVDELKKDFADCKEDDKKEKLRDEWRKQRFIETDCDVAAPAPSSVLSWSVFTDSKFASLRQTWFVSKDEERIKFAPRAVWCLMEEHARRLDVGASTDEAYVF